MTRNFTTTPTNICIEYNNGHSGITGIVLSSDNIGVEIESKGSKFFIPWTSIKNVQYVDGE